MTQPSATVVLDSVSPAGKRLTTFQITAHRFVLAEINTHRMLSRNYRSSRAVPSAKLIEEVRTNPAMPIFWGANQKGMQAAEELSDVKDGLDLATGRTFGEIESSFLSQGRYVNSSPRERAEYQWRAAASYAATSAEELAKTGLHKQIANRVLEPFLWVHGVVTATEWENFFGLRLHSAAQPEFRVLAEAMWKAREASTPKLLYPGEWHTPYADGSDGWLGKSCEVCGGCGQKLDESLGVDKACGGCGGTGEAYSEKIVRIVSVARCARVSIRPFDAERPSKLEEDLTTYAKLNLPGTESYDPTAPIHASPAEHQATPDEVHGPFDITIKEPTEEDRRERRMDVSIVGRGCHPEQWGNFVGWRQYRKMLPGESCAPLPKGYEK